MTRETVVEKFLRCIKERESAGLTYWVVDDHETMRMDLHVLAASMREPLTPPPAPRVAVTEAAIGNDGKEWPETFDGMAWAIEFNKRFASVSVDDALGWFCVAIMRGYDSYAQKHENIPAAALADADAGGDDA
jgi:hypothetical protein